jgi:hypothetical protein
VGYYREEVCVITRENVTHENEEVWFITKRKCGLLPREGVAYYEEKR